MKKICIVGGGFGGLEALKHLKEGLSGRRNVRVTLINERSHFLFTPVLPDVASGSVSSRSAQLRLAQLLDDGRFELICGRAERFDLERRQVSVGERRVDFDHLIVAVGSEIDWRGLEDPDKLAMGWKGAEDAQRIYRAVVSAFDGAGKVEDEAALRRRLTFVVAGAGASGVELTAELVSGVRRALLPRAGAQAARAFRVVLVEPRGAALPDFAAPLQARAAGALGRLGVEMIFGDRVEAVSAGEVRLGSGDRIEADHLIWAGGVKAPSWLSGSGLPLTGEGWIEVDDRLCAVDGVFAIGDAARRRRGEPWPMTAQCAVQQGPVAANNVLMDMVGASLDPFEYAHFGDLIRLGERDGIFQLGGLRLTGPTAWGLIRLAQVMLAPTMTKKMALLGEWMENVVRGHEWTRLPIEG